MTCRFKLPQFTFKDGNTSEGPTVFDKDGNLWNQKELIGNGSKMRIGYDIYAWGADSTTGAGLTLQPRAAQVVEWLAAPDSVARTTASDFGFDSTKAADEAVKAAADAKELSALLSPTHLRQPMASPSDGRRFHRQADADAARIIELLVEISAKLGPNPKEQVAEEVLAIQQPAPRRGRRKKSDEQS